MERGLPGRAGSGHQPCGGGDILRSVSCRGIGLSGRNRALQALPDATRPLLGGYRSGAGRARARRAHDGPLAKRARSLAGPSAVEAVTRPRDVRLPFLVRGCAGNAPAPEGRDQYSRTFCTAGLHERTFSVDSRWCSGTADITTFELDELLATKLRALYQRRKGRDLFDLAIGLDNERSNAGKIVAAFQEYMARDGVTVTRTLFERNLAGKLRNPQFSADMSALPRAGFEWKPEEAAQTVARRLIRLLPGEPWKGKTEI